MAATLPKAIQINEQVSVGPQPNDEDIRQLADQQFGAVVNFRAEGERGQPFSPKQEGEKVRDAGMEYLNIPISVDSLGPDVVDRFRDQFEGLSKPVYAHCKGGTRAAAMVMMQLACEQGMSGEQALHQAQELGFACDNSELIAFVRAYVDSRTAKT
jgi:uncharacterized protein (TIGR01244 family)